MPPAFPATRTNSFPAVTDISFSAFRMLSVFILPSATIRIQESSVALIETVKGCAVPDLESEGMASEAELCFAVGPGEAGVSESELELRPELEMSGLSVFGPGPVESFFSLG